MTQRVRSDSASRGLRRLAMRPCLILILLTLSHATARWAHAEVISFGSPQKDQETTRVEPGQKIERELGGDQLHSYLVALTAGQFLEAVVEQQRVNLALILYSPEGAKLLETGSPTRIYGPQTLVSVSERSGVYKLEVRSTRKDSSPGSYTLKISELKDADDRDRKRVSAQQALSEGYKLRLQRPQYIDEERAKYEKAQAIAQSAGDHRAEALAAMYKGGAELALGDYQKALDDFTEAHAIWQTLGERKEEAALLYDFAAIYKDYLGDQEKAVAIYDEALKIWREVGDRRGEADLVYNVGLFYSRLGEYQKALDYYQQALALRRAVGDRLEESNTLNQIGTLYYSFGDYQEALDYYQQVLSIVRKEGNRPRQAGLLNNIAQMYGLLGEREKAFEYFDQSVKLWRETGDRRGESDQLSNIAGSYEYQGDYEKALSYYNQALSLRRELGDRQKQVFTLVDLSQLYVKTGERQKALDNLREAIAILPTSMGPGSRATFLNLFGDAWTGLGDTKQALNYYEQALALLKPLRSPRNEASTLYKIALTERDLGDLVAARRQIEAALGITESLRARITNQEWRSAFFASVRQYYQLYIDLLMQLHKVNPSAGLDAEALRVSELARARNLLDLLAEARAEIKRGVDPKMLERQHALQRQLNLKAEEQTRLLSGKHTEEQAAKLAQAIRALAAAYEEAQAQMRASSPRYAELIQPKPLTSKDIQQMLDSETTLIEYALGSDRSYIFCVTRERVASYELPSRTEIEAEAKNIYKLLTARNLRPKNETEEQRQPRLALAEAEYTTASAHLSGMLLGPIAQSIGSKRLVVVADGALHYLPFAALPLPQMDKSASRDWQPLGATHEVVNLPSASVLGLLRSEAAGRKPAPKAVAVIADPVFDRDDARVMVAKNKTQRQVIAQVSSLRAIADTANSSLATRLARDVERSAGEVAMGDNGSASIPRLSFSRREADAIVALTPKAGALKAVDFEASLATATSQRLAQYRVIHFATHGLLNTQHPELSGVILSLVDERGAPRDGFLRLNEIYNLNLPADLVVLSSCNSALGKEVRGEGLVGLTRGFMYAGATRVVASLWKVDDAATAEFMKSFYRKILREEMRPAAALRAAQVEMSAQQRWQSPYYWAAFVLQGEWK